MSITAPLLEVCVPSGIFCWRNIEKVKNGDKARGSVAFAQGAKIFQAASQCGDTFASSASTTLSNLAKESKVVNYAGKAVNWATKNVNPLICASAAIKTITAEDKIGTGINETGALAGMFAGEGLMKLHLPKLINEKNVTAVAKSIKDVKFLEPVSKFLLKTGNSSKIAAIVKGITFVCGSIMSYNLGHKLAESQSERIKAGLGIKTPEKTEATTGQKIDQKA